MSTMCASARARLGDVIALDQVVAVVDLTIAVQVRAGPIGFVVVHARVMTTLIPADSRRCSRRRAMSRFMAASRTPPNTAPEFGLPCPASSTMTTSFGSTAYGDSRGGLGDPRFRHARAG